MLEAAELIIFDLDGTLIDSRVDITNSVNVALRDIGLPPKTTEQIVGMIGNGTRALVQRAVGHDPDRFRRAFAVFTKDYGLHLLDHTTLYPGVRETIDHFAGRKKMAVMSNKRQRFCDAILEGLGLTHRFEVIQGGDTATAKKPDPAPLLHICERLGIDPTRTAMVGDSTVDVTAGEKAGMYTVGILEGFTPAEIMRGSGADLLVPTVASLRTGSKR